MPKLSNDARQRAIEVEAEMAIEMMQQDKQQPVGEDNININGRIINKHRLRNFIIEKMHAECEKEINNLIASIEKTLSAQPLTRQSAIGSEFLKQLHNQVPKPEFPWQGADWQQQALCDYIKHSNRAKPSS